MKIEGKLLSDIRCSHGLSQKILAERSGLSLRTIKSAEAGSLSARTVKHLAAALGMSSASLVAQLGGMPPSAEPPRFLLQQIFPDSSYDIIKILREGAVSDIRGDFADASATFEKALEAVATDDFDNKAQIIIRYATALDNANKSEEAVERLNQLLLEARTQYVKPWIVKWMKYHVGLAYRRIAERDDARCEAFLKESELLLEEVQATGEVEQRIAATHQLGCVWLVRADRSPSTCKQEGALRRAERYFKEAKEKWQRTGNFREGYALRRLADVCEARGERLSAHTYLLDALEVFVRHDCYRYREDVRNRLDRLVRGGIYVADGTTKPSL